MVIKSQTKEVKGLSCVTVIAKWWNIKILKYEYVSRLIKQLHNHLNIGTSQATDIVVKKLKHPFIKVEDRTLPTLLHGVSRVPFHKLWIRASRLSIWLSRHFQESNLVKNCQKPKIRFCECCDVNYTDLNAHLESRKHREFASNDSNYARINEFIIKKWTWCWNL